MSLWPPPRSSRHSGRRVRLPFVLGAAALALAAVVGGVTWALWPDEEQPLVTDGIPHSYAGSWSGEMAQYDEAGELVTDWVVRLKLDEGTDRGSADLLPLDCRGSIVLTERTDDFLVFEYAETYDPENRCIDESTLTLAQQVPGTLEAEWVGTSREGTVMTSTGTLK
ncbi:hypothetical protein NI17_023230 [Thermobifida halotolerans]|uniref:Uncharacterized protein n=2 Tax=Thermobifida halotolerans TaxID=483545 RepID=A0A399G234_9ACTN|nr:hypothetical protein [Thermobifida halotolerans]UOE22217.1 hypothetical protein NI17_023230 [Thermobifida halotolerans]